MKKKELAIKEYTEAIRPDPSHAHAYRSRGTEYLKKGQYDQAIKDYTEAIRLDPNYHIPYAYRGEEYHRMGLYT